MASGAGMRKWRVLIPFLRGFPVSVGVFKNGRVEIIANDQGNRITPSYVAFTPEGERLIGDAAKNQLTSNPENTVFDAKRLIGRTWNDPSVQQDIKFLPFKVGPGFFLVLMRRLGRLGRKNTVQRTYLKGCGRSLCNGSTCSRF